MPPAMPAQNQRFASKASDRPVDILPVRVDKTFSLVYKCKGYDYWGDFNGK